MDIFVINTSDSDNIKPELLEEFRHKEFSNANKKKEHCFAYLMLDRILKEVYKIEKREIEFIDNKPYLKNRDKFFSISHSKEILAIAFSENECGIDVEKITDRDFKAIAERMNFPSKTLEEFYFDWTKYEAEYKLGAAANSIKQIIADGYALTAVCENFQETFDIYIQNGEQFPNL